MDFTVTPPSDPNVTSYVYSGEKQTLSITLKDGTTKTAEDVSTATFCTFATSTDLLAGFNEIATPKP